MDDCNIYVYNSSQVIDSSDKHSHLGKQIE